MNILENTMVNILIDLKENYNVAGVKSEFEAEGAGLEETVLLKEIALSAGLNLTIKIGGAEAIRDMIDAKTIGANTVIAPMIETPYALKKFVNAIQSVFTQEEAENIKFFINIETITSFNNFDKIIETPEFGMLSGITVGRTDLTASMGLNKEDVNNDVILDITNIIAAQLPAASKEMGIGGGILAESLPFLKNLSSDVLTKFETRKVIFEAQQALQNPKIETGILKAIEFELMWIKNKRENYKIVYEKDAQRLIKLYNYYNQLAEKNHSVPI